MRFINDSLRGISILNHALRRMAKREIFRAKIAGISIEKNIGQRPFFVLQNPRTGSTFFLNCLNSYPNISFLADVLSPYSYFGIRRFFISKKALLDHVRRCLHYLEHPVCGVKIGFSHLKMHRMTLKDLSAEFPQAKWIVLYRKNILDQYISHQIALRTQRWFQSPGDPYPALEDVRIDLSPQSVLEYRNRILRDYQSVLKNPEICSRSVWVSYEDIVVDSQKLFDEVIFPFMGLDRKNIGTRLMKQNIWQYPEIIANYEEVGDFIEKTDFTLHYERYPDPLNP